jgi:hypothetical protein
MRSVDDQMQSIGATDRGMKVHKVTMSEQSMDKVWADLKWKWTMDLSIMDLKDRVEIIENQLSRKLVEKPEGFLKRSNDLITSKISRIRTSFATAGDDGLGGLKTCLQMVKSTRLASVQCVWLTLCTIFFAYFIIFHCTRVNRSRNAEFKPQKKFLGVNFATDTEEYRMPNFSLIVSSPMDDTGFAGDLRQMVDSSNFVCLYYFDVNTSNNFRLAKNISINRRNEYGLRWMVTITPENPVSGSGPWYCVWRFRSKQFTEALFHVSRHYENDINVGSFKPMHLSFPPNETAVVSFDYSETVIETFLDETIYEFDTSINEIYMPSDPSVDFNVELYITMHPKVSY